MPTITYDGRSFAIDGRRVWLVSGAIHYTRVPRAAWADRIRAAKQAGFNTIETPVRWSDHEIRPGSFDFEGDRDLRHFVQLVGEAGLFCVLRPGPFVGSGWDLGGLPAWLIGQEDMALRTNSRPFLEASSRYLTAVAKQVRDLQVTSTGGGGPIILVQNEAHWTCGNDTLAAEYLGELHRYLREAGFTVPTINGNNLWQAVEGEIEAWSGTEHLLAVMRQMAVVRPDHPRLVIDFSPTSPSTFGESGVALPDPHGVQRRLAEALAAGAQFNVDPLCGGTNFGFSGGRLPYTPDGFVTNTNDRHAPLTEAGLPGATWGPVRRLAMFSSQFGKVFANLDLDHSAAVLNPASAGGGKHGSGLSVVHLSGSQGEVVFVFGADPAGSHSAGPRQAQLLLTDGSTTSIDLGAQGVGWYLRDVHLTGRATLDWTSLNAFALVGSVLVLFGPAGSEGEVSINGSPIPVAVPGGKQPNLIEHEGLTLVICSESLIDLTWIGESEVFIGVTGLDAQGTPIPASGYKQITRISAAGESSRESVNGAPRAPRRPTFDDWQAATIDANVDGSSPRYAAVEGPADLAAYGSAYGYGWYRLIIRATSAKKPKVVAPQSADRLHFFADGEPIGVLGSGPGADREIHLPLKKGQRTFVVLAENLGRYSAGPSLGEPKGLYGHLWESVAFKSGRMSVVDAQPIDLLGFRSPLWNVREGDTTDPRRITWKFTHRKKSPILVTIEPMPAAGVLVCNDTPIRFLEQGVRHELCLTDELTRGNNVLQIALVHDATDEDKFADLLRAVGASTTINEGANCISEKADWAFAKWEQPKKSAFKASNKPAAGTPCWWRSTFSLLHPEVPLYLELEGVSKGQIYINGHHLGRYWIATGTGKGVGPQRKHLIPGSWLHADKPNEVVLFEEHGKDPSKCQLVHDTSGGSVLLTP